MGLRKLIYSLEQIHGVNPIPLYDSHHQIYVSRLGYLSDLFIKYFSRTYYYSWTRL